MKLKKLTIKNFKSLGDVTIEPSDLTVIIGPNGSGKTNLANAFAFLKEVYANGLETAVQRSGGFENIASASTQDSISHVSFDLHLTLSPKEFRQMLVRFEFEIDDNKDQLAIFKSEVSVNYSFSFSSQRREKFSDFRISHEFIEFKNDDSILLNIERNYNKVKQELADQLIRSRLRLRLMLNRSDTYSDLNISSQQLLLVTYPLQSVLKNFISFMSGWAVYQLLPNTAKEPGVPTPNPALTLYGSNLPVLVDHIIRKENNTWTLILDTMRRVVPTLTDIKTGYLYNKNVGLFFYEEGFDRPWNAEEVSDGTILTLAMLCSVNDPRSTLVFIEEPENSIHPWILRKLLENFKEVSKRKNIIVTTHSPTLIDMVAPNDIWCISKLDRKTQLNRLTDIAENLQADWEAGAYKISEYLDSGLIPQAIPGGSI